VPIIGQGGIMSANDAIEFIIAGAATVGIGTALFYDPLVCNKINDGISQYLTNMTAKPSVPASMQRCALLAMLV
jgi:dihydroorotate dehydrogenase (NAD+) catalytic subunit